MKIVEHELKSLVLDEHFVMLDDVKQGTAIATRPSYRLVPQHRLLVYNTLIEIFG